MGHLSNTAVPKYYGEFRDKVLAGEIPVNREVSMEMNRIDELIEDPMFYYDENAIEGFIAFCEEELTLTDGSPVTLLPMFKVWAEQVFGWYYFIDKSVYVPYKDNHGGRYKKKRVKKRLINKQYIILGRGGAKSMYASFMHSHFLVNDPTTTHQVVTAPTMRQANETIGPIKTAITRARGPYFKFLTEGSIQNTTGSRANRPKLCSTKKGIENFMTNSIVEVRAMSIDKLQGLRCKLSTVDEWLSGDIREDVIGALEQGAAKEQGGRGNDDYLIIAISSEGTVRNSTGDSIKMELMKILKGEYYNPHVSIWYYRLDDIKEINYPELWMKANPNIGYTVSYETYQEDVTRAENVPEARNDIIAKRFGIPVEGFTYFFTYEETIPFRHREYWQHPCAMGFDGSQGDDFCAFTFLFPLARGDFGVKTRCYITHVTLDKLESAMRQKYTEFIDEGTLVVMETAFLDMMDIYEDVDLFIEKNQYDVRAFGYDPYNAKEFVERWITENGEYGVEKVIQGARTESVPLGEIKSLTENQQLLFDEKIMSFTMGNCIVIEDTNGNRKLSKIRRDRKIDSVAALLDAFVAWKLNKEAFE